MNSTAQILLTTKEAAAMVGKSWCTLRNWRKGKKVWQPGLRGPKFNNIHGRILYKEEDVLDWYQRFGRIEP
ncbi:hypothetical protein [Mailhella sp.]